ncbi:unnamed protein product [marine sediment metagenome]|uniref:Uncharacterized protein n=1 Tax=marine sediment metagenome TaxID=412755 RepID=X1R979_9ZZZZ
MLPTDIDKLTDEQLDEFLASVELKCKIEPETGKMICPIPEDINRAIARLRQPVKQVVFEVTTESAPAAPVAE